LNAYIILFGRSIWASLNTYYAVLLKEKNDPDLIWIVTEPQYEQELSVLGEGLEIISQGFDLKPTIRSTILLKGDIVEAGTEIKALVDKLKEEYTVSLDITSARKALVAGALLSTTNNRPAYTYYLKIDTLDDISKPYPMIPGQHHELVDFREETKPRTQQ